MEISELGVKPISEEKPAGEDVRRSEDFEALQAQIDLLSMVGSGGQSIDWPRVEELSRNILADKSKNILVAAYLAAALQEQYGLQGLADGASLMRDLTANFWDSMYPPKKRLRGRLNAYEWWKDKATAFLKNFEAQQPQDKDLVQGLADAIGELNEILGEKSEDAPVLREPQELAQSIPVQEPEQPEQRAADAPAGRPAAQQTAAQQPPAAAASVPSPPADASSMEPADAEKLYKQGLGVLSAYSDWLVSQNPRDPLRFRIPRWNAWTPVRSLPPADGASTQLPPPEKQILDSINQLVSQSNYEQALKESEPRVTQYIFWIDLSYAGAVALKGLGDDWAEALAAVESETYLFIKRLPGIENLTFNDGTPFCSEEAQNWLRSLDQGSGGGEPQADSVDKALAEARKKAAAKDVIGALGSLDSALNADGRVRNRYRLQVGMLKLLARTENAKLAAAYVEDVVKYIDRHNLEEWEPELALEGLGAAYGALRNGEDQAVGELAQKIFARMGRISPAHALRAAGPAE